MDDSCSEETHDTRKPMSERAAAGWRRAGDMHHNVPVWSDPCCCCEAEPYWREVAPELGIDPDGDGSAS
ncbi:MAG: hypothetical protein P8124_07560 [Gammaproteobacteria bacterium]